MSLVEVDVQRHQRGMATSNELIELCASVIEDLEIARRARERLSDDDGTRFDIAQVSADLGLDLDWAWPSDGDAGDRGE
jgi:hypothetical protein